MVTPIVMLFGVLTLVATQAPAAVPRYYVMRHLERTAQGDSLNQAGRANACRLARWFAKRPLAAIRTSRFARAVQTAKLVAVARGITPATSGTVVGLVASARAAGKPVLVVGNSLSVERLIQGLGGKPPPDPPFNFGRIWTIWSNGRTTLERLPQNGTGCTPTEGSSSGRP